MMRRNGCTQGLLAATSGWGKSLAGLGLALALCMPSIASAQVGLPKTLPNAGYFAGFDSFYDGDFRSAREIFRDAGKAGYVSVDGRWIDSICFHTMIGENYYQMGDFTNALDQYASALKLFLAHRDWMLRVEFSPGIDPEQNIKNSITWGTSQRRTQIGHFTGKFQMMTGDVNAAQKFRTGGVVVQAELHSVYVSEIIRCTALAISRRREIMGPLSPHDLLTTQVLDACMRRPAPPNHWSQCWAELQLGMASAAAGKASEAVAELSRSLLAGGQYDHPLTCVALLELGKLAFDAGKLEPAINFFMEASYSAAVFERYDVLEESLRLAALAHVVSGGKEPFLPLVNAAAWAKQKRLRHLGVSLLIALAESLSTQGETAAANAAIAQARQMAGKSEMLGGQVGARLNYETARSQFMAGNLVAGNTTLALAMAYQKVSSRRLFQIGLADTLISAGTLSERVADNVYAETLREPTATDWLTDPMETLSVVSNPHPLPFEHWFELALARNEVDKALNIADRIRRHRFFATQPLGGRLLAIRWILEAPQEALGEEGKLHHQELLNKYPALTELGQKTAAIRKNLADLPLVVEDADDAKKHKQQLVDLAKVSLAQEVILQQIALRREPSAFVFPPLRETKLIQANLKDGQLVLSYLQTSRALHAFALTHKESIHFPLPTTAKVKTDTQELLRGLGLFDRNREIPVADLVKSNWKVIAEKLLGQLTNGTKPADWDKYQELIIVPDGLLWYVPFEALQVKKDGESVPLGSLLKVRYAPTLGLAISDGRPKKRLAKTAIVAGKLSPREDEKNTKEAAEQLVTAVPGTEVLTTALAPSAVFGSTLDRLVVLADLEDTDKQPYGWSPLPLDKGKAGNSLADWFSLPWQSPEQMVLPTFHSAAEFGLKKGGTGEDIFLSVCGLMSTGTRSVLISRWRMGGESTCDLVREYVQELPHTAAIDSWRRSVNLWKKKTASASTEPRIKFSAAVDSLPGEHPLFWAGYMLIDSDQGELKAVQPTDAKGAKPPVPKAEAKPAEKMVEKPAEKDAEKPAAKPAPGKGGEKDKPEKAKGAAEAAADADPVIGDLLKPEPEAKPKGAGKSK